MSRLIPTSDLADYITGLARQHGIHYARNSNDALTETITRLGDDRVEMDQIALLLLALERAGVIPSEDVVPLHINYLREKLNDSLTHSIPQADIPMNGLSAYIADLAQRHDIRYVQTGTSVLAEVITRLSGEDVKPDETEKLVIALRRANVIDGKTMVTLLGRYFDEARKLGDINDHAK